MSFNSAVVDESSFSRSSRDLKKQAHTTELLYIYFVDIPSYYLDIITYW